MKRLTFAAAIIAAATTLTGCGLGSAASLLGTAASSTMGADTAGNIASGVASALTSQNTIGNLLSTFLGGATINEASLYGTWTYQGTDVAFESENLLAKAGGAVAAGTIEQKLDEQLGKYGIKAGSVKFTFNKDHTFSANLGGKNVSGTYTYDEKSRQMNLVAALGLFSQTCTVGTTGTGISLLFPADKLLSLVSTAGAIAGAANSSIATLSSLVSNYNGMQIGLAMSK